MRVRFFGVRGSLSWARTDAMGHGCNTACLDLADAARGARLVLDAGSGIVGLGHELDGESGRLAIALTHYHWDHVIGLPLLAPLFRHGWSAHFWAPELGEPVRPLVAAVFAPPFFVVPFDELPAAPTVEGIGPGRHRMGGFDVEALMLHHPGGALAYRIRGAGGDLVYATDHEIGNPGIDAAFAAFAHGARELVLDAQYTPAELPHYQGWGHSSWAQAAEFAARHGVGRLWLFHHDPTRSDAELDAIVAAARAIFPDTEAAREGVAFDV